MGRGAQAVAALTGVGAATVAYAALIERRSFRLREVEAPILAPGSTPLRVLHISDVHMIGRQRDKQAWIRDLGRLEPDLVLHTGDTLSAPDGVPAVLDAFAPLLERPGAFVLGSNDYYEPVFKNPFKYFNPKHRRTIGPELPWGELVKGFTDAGWLDLTNTREAITLPDGRRVDLRGVDDPHLKLDRHAAIDGPADPDADVRVGMVHAPEPRVLDLFVADGCDLLVCGHTHGGQLRVPGYGALVTNCKLDRKRARGLSSYGAGGRLAHLHVSAGLGTSPYAPIRFACPPEATLLSLVGRPQ
ncbi:MAG TPA: metallophosphoesterase [Mycobacteriales bacterium]|nr:metallophosphoesterase [Mycobacteriales bacterium]